MSAKDEGPKHPATVRYDRINPDGSVSAFSIDEQWQQVADWHAFLEADKASEYPVLDGYNEAWAELDSLYQLNGESIIERGAELRRVSDNPLSTFFYFVDMGFYPPPELMLTLLDCWETYISNAGKLTLEEAFLGPTRKGVGNYAARKNHKFRLIFLRLEFDRMLREGKRRTEIAEELSNRLGGKPDADSILRVMRGFNGFFARHAGNGAEK